MSSTSRSSVFYSYEFGCSSASEDISQMFRVNTTLSSRTVDLPSEIWFDIFDFATHIPGVLTLNNITELEAYGEDEDGIILHDLYHESMHVKLAISRVSRSWRRIVTPLLFQCILIRSGPHARAISDAFTYFRSHQAYEDFAGRWVKRIELSVEDDYWEQDSLLSLANILDCTPNLTTFSDLHSMARVPEGFATQEVVRKLYSLCEKGNLKRLEWSGPTYFPLGDLLYGAKSSLEVLMTKQLSEKSVSLPKLQTLVLRNATSTDRIDLSELGSPKLFSLMTFSESSEILNPLSPSSPQLISQYSVFPSLKHLHCVLSPNNNPSELLQRISSLESLTLDFCRQVQPRNLNKYSIRLPNMQKIVLQRFPSLQSRNDQHNDPQALRSCYEFLLNLIDRKNNPSLKAVGFQISRSYGDEDDYITTDDVATRDGFWEAFISQCNKQNIKLEASVGAVDHVLANWYPFHLGLLPQNLLIQ